eukprot:CAMPEP_0180665528 /NCGR_PEP_ID=MMETSP1037_2-20121125/61325_1 /TAXON_ID=632150 /ORGANISM="Azadinium spinosum, Strain 3D9" /LENGTH=41 /DNA_ID= /DNA_START= /DNA_END= /DNA_ORIENTATION=
MVLDVKLVILDLVPDPFSVMAQSAFLLPAGLTNFGVRRSLV